MSIGQCECLHMTEHKGTSFAHSCVKVPVDPFSRYPSPLYERPKCTRPKEKTLMDLESRTRTNNKLSDELMRSRKDFYNFLEFIDTIPDYSEIKHLSNEEFKEKIDYLKRKQRLLLKNLHNCLEEDKDADAIVKIKSPIISDRRWTSKLPRPNNSACSEIPNSTELSLCGKRCNLEESRTTSPLLYSTSSFSCLAEDQDLLTHRCKDHRKAEKTRLNEEILSSTKGWSSGSESKGIESAESDDQINELTIETKSLPAQSPKRWQPTIPKPFSFTLSSPTENSNKINSMEEAEKYMAAVEKEAEENWLNYTKNKKNLAKKRRLRTVPLTSKLPLYEKLLAEKEERSRMVRQESVFNLLSQVRPFKLECDRRALRTLSRSSPELSEKKKYGRTSKFTGKPIPRNLCSTDLYYRMIDDEYFRDIEKRVRDSELMRSSSLPPSMARGKRCKSAVNSREKNTTKSSSEEINHVDNVECDKSSMILNRDTPVQSARSKSSTMIPPHGTNLAAILRAQVSKEKLEREVQEKLEEKRRDQMIRLRKALIGRKPAWKALRSAARHEHDRDLYLRTALLRDELREQDRRYRHQMERMIDRVTQIPTLFERHSQNFQSTLYLSPKLHETPKRGRQTYKKKKKLDSKHQGSSSADSYASYTSSRRPNSGSPTSSSGTPPYLRSSSISRNSRWSTKKKKQDRGPLKVSINETAELIEDVNYDDEPLLLEDKLHRVKNKSTLEDKAKSIEKDFS